MKTFRCASVAALGLIGLAMGCGKILGIEEKQYVEGGGGGAAATAKCELLDKQAAAVRIMNAIPDSSILDICAKSAAGGGYGEPWFLESDGACGPGVAYTKYTQNLGIAAGTYDFKLVLAGENCSAPGLESKGVSVTEASSVTLFAYGPRVGDAKLSVLRDRVAEGLDIPVRFVNGLNTPGTLTAGMANTATDPPTFLAPIFRDVPLGAVAAESEGGPTSVDDVLADGYTLFGGGETSRTDLPLGVAEGDSDELSWYVPVPVVLGHAYTLFALGNPNDRERRGKLWSCDETEADGLFLRCGNPVNVAFEVYNPNLTDAFTPWVAERTGPATKAAVGSDADVLCLTELYDPKVKELVSSQESSHFKYRRFSDDVPRADWRAPPPLQSGAEPEYNPTACPAGGDEDFAALLNDFLQCGIDGACLVEANDGEHELAAVGADAAGCFFEHCKFEAAALFMLASDAVTGVNCYMCAITHLSSYESSETTRQACSSPSEEPQHYVFSGTTGLGVLSKYPLGEPEVVELPSSYWRRAAMRVPVTLPNGKVVDHWCASLRFPSAEQELPYAGVYGAGKGGFNGTVNEQTYEAQHLVDTVKSRRKATGTPAVVGVVTFSGPELKDEEGNVLVNAQAAQTYEVLDQAWPRLVAADYTPACTFCGSPEVNPLNSASEAVVSFWSTHLFADGISSDAVQSTERTFMEREFAPNPKKPSALAPVSQHFGLRSVVAVTQ